MEGRNFLKTPLQKIGPPKNWKGKLLVQKEALKDIKGALRNNPNLLLGTKMGDPKTFPSKGRGPKEPQEGPNP